ARPTCKRCSAAVPAATRSRWDRPMVAQHEVLGKARNRRRVPEGRLKLTNVIETRDQASLRDAKPLLTLTQHSVLGYLRIVPTGQFSPSRALKPKCRNSRAAGTAALHLYQRFSPSELQ